MSQSSVQLRIESREELLLRHQAFNSVDSLAILKQDYEGVRQPGEGTRATLSRAQHNALRVGKPAMLNRLAMLPYLSVSTVA